MSVYSDQCFNREKAVLLSAELLRDAGVAFFPIDVKRLLASFRQLYLFPYSTIGDRSDPEKRAAAIAALPSKDGFCTRIHDVLIDFGDGPVDGYNWNIYYNDSSLEARIRFTLMHELGHVLLGHHQTLNTDTITGKEDDPEYRAADAQADQFSINILAPAPAVFQLLKEHGFSCLKATGGRWKLTNRNAPFLRYLGKLPDPVELITVAFGLSQAAAERRLAELNDELAIWLDLDERLYHFITGMAHRSGWYCWVCNTRRRTTSPYCPGCGKGWDYIYKDHGRFSRPVMSLRKNGQFAFCSVCGNTEFPDDAAFCPVCGCPVINECENAYHTDGDFIRSGMHIVRGTHRCRPTDIYCGTCGVLTAFGAQHASIAFEGNTFRSVADMMRTTNLFEPFPVAFNNDSAFFDRIHAYLPGWETPKLRSSLFTTGYGLISDCFSEFCHAMRKYDFTNSFSAYFTLNKCFNTRDTIAVGRTFSGLAKLIHPDERMTKEEVREILEYAIEGRRRVKEQLRKMTPGEFSDVDLGYIDDDTGEEIIVELPEVSGGTLIRQGFEKPGYVYGVGRSVTNVLGIYRLENKLVSGTGTFSFRNVEGLARAPKSVRDSITAAFNYFGENARRIIAGSYEEFDYSLYFNDLQNRGVSDRP